MNFDLNIDNYTRDELIEMFDLPPIFDTNTVELKETKLRDTIIKNKEINKDTQIQTVNFLIKAKNIILNPSMQNQTPRQENHENKFKDVILDIYNSSYKLKPTPLEDPAEHMVQVRHNKPYLSSFPSEFFPGVINPLKKRTIKKNLNIDTRFRDNYYANSSTNFNVTLPTTFNDVLQMQLASFEMPTSYYVVSKQYGNNFFTITVNGVSGVINIPDGNYDNTSIMTSINKELDNLGGEFQHVVFTVSLTNGTTGSCQTLVGFDGSQTPTNSTLELNFQADKYGIDDRGTPLPLKFGWLLGFRNGVYVNNQNYVSEGIVDLTGSKYYYLVVDDYNNNVNNSFYSAFNSSLLNKNILARISCMQTPSFNLLQQNNLNIVTTPREYFGPVNIVTFNIQLLDEYGRVIDLNNMDYSFCLTLITGYDI
jgi:hypothetical protein